MQGRDSFGFGCLLAIAASALWPSDARATDPATVEWSDDWPRIRIWEVGAAAALTVGDTAFEQLVPLPKQADWHGGILFDSWARQEFRGRTAQEQSDASTLSDIFYKGGALVPFIVDDFFAAASIHENASVSLQLMVIDFEALG